jgi:hypothetical protein
VKVELVASFVNEPDRFHHNRRFRLKVQGARRLGWNDEVGVKQQLHRTCGKRESFAEALGLQTIEWSSETRNFTEITTACNA